jgi:hypothetical protein
MFAWNLEGMVTKIRKATRYIGIEELELASNDRGQCAVAGFNLRTIRGMVELVSPPSMTTTRFYPNSIAIISDTVFVQSVRRLK